MNAETIAAGAASPPRRRLSAAERRARILTAAMELFAERGYEGTTIGEIAVRAGITAAVIYDHFPSKAALQIELLEGQTAELLRFAAAAVHEAACDPAQRMRAGVEAFFCFVEEHRFAWRMMFRDPPSDPEVAAAHLKLERQATAGIAALLLAGDAEALAGEPDRERAATVYAEMLKMAQNGLAAWWYEHPEVPREEIVARVMQFCWHGLGELAAGAK